MSYHRFQFPALSPATKSTALRAGSKTNKILISERPADAGRNSFKLCLREPLIRSTSGARAAVLHEPTCRSPLRPGRRYSVLPDTAPRTSDPLRREVRSPTASGDHNVGLISIRAWRPEFPRRCIPTPGHRRCSADTRPHPREHASPPPRPASAHASSAPDHASDGSKHSSYGLKHASSPFPHTGLLCGKANSRDQTAHSRDWTRNSRDWARNSRDGGCMNAEVPAAANPRRALPEPRGLTRPRLHRSLRSSRHRCSPAGRPGPTRAGLRRGRRSAPCRPSRPLRRSSLRRRPG